jgi:hypothetical protein
MDSFIESPTKSETSSHAAKSYNSSFEDILTKITSPVYRSYKTRFRTICASPDSYGSPLASPGPPRQRASSLSIGSSVMTETESSDCELAVTSDGEVEFLGMTKVQMSAKPSKEARLSSIDWTSDSDDGYISDLCRRYGHAVPHSRVPKTLTFSSSPSQSEGGSPSRRTFFPVSDLTTDTQEPSAPQKIYKVDIYTVRCSYLRHDIK